MTDDAPALRTGWTTGACATAAARAAFTGLCSGTIPGIITITLPKGQMPTFAVIGAETGAGWAQAFVEKDAGDDPDVTHGALVGVRVALREHGTGIRFHAGPGVGTVTKPGLPIPPGEPAINPVPRLMITEALEAVARDYAVRADLDVTVTVPGGEALAEKTWNPRLGIEGGLSILGTTGIVRPFSCAAWIASIHRGIDVARAMNLDHVIGATGATSEATTRTLYDLPEQAFLDMGDFAGGLVKYLRTHPVPRLTIAGGPGKMTKLAQGALDLHSKRSQVDFDALARRVELPKLAFVNTALEAFSMAGAPLAEAIASDAQATLRNALRDAPVTVETIIVGRDGAVLARMPFR